jgi:hypothetical protein
MSLSADRAEAMYDARVARVAARYRSGTSADS